VLTVNYLDVMKILEIKLGRSGGSGGEKGTNRGGGWSERENIPESGGAATGCRGGQGGVAVMRERTRERA
jgi:hypothetical protein